MYFITYLKGALSTFFSMENLEGQQKIKQEIEEIGGIKDNVIKQRGHCGYTGHQTLITVNDLHSFIDNVNFIYLFSPKQCNYCVTFTGPANVTIKRPSIPFQIERQY